MKQLSLVALLVLFSAPAMAYVGPGLGMGVIGTVFGVLAAIVLALFGLFWYPLKRKFGKKKSGAEGRPISPVVSEKKQTDDVGNTVQTRADTSVEARPNHRGVSHADALNAAHDPATANRTDNTVQ